MPQGGVDLTLTVGSNTYDLMVARDQNGVAAFKRFPAPPLNPVVNQTGIIDYAAQNPVEGITRDIDDFSQGCGAFIYDPINDPGRYALGENVDTRWGYAIPGPREVADVSGINTGYMPIKRILHGNINWILTNNGTDTEVYRIEAGVWVRKLNVFTTFAAHVLGTDLVSFGNVVAVALGGSTAYVFSSDNGTTWTASTKAGNAKYATYFCVAQYGQLLPKVWYVRDPADLYATADLTNTGVSSGPTTIGDSSNDEFNSLVRDASTNLLLMGKRHLLFTVDSAGVVTVVAGPYRYVTTSDDGSGAAAANFKDPVVIQNRIYYRVEDYRLIEVSGGVVTENLQPGIVGPQIPRMQLPINGMAAINGELWVAIGTNQPSTIRDLVGIIPGDSLVSNSFSTISELYVGRYQNDNRGNLVWRWHGIILKGTIAIIRYMWYDDAQNFLYMSKRAAVQTRAFVPLTNPLTVLTGGIVYLSLATWQLEMGLDNQQVNADKTLRKGFARTGVLGTTPTITLQYRTANDDVNTAFATLATYTSATTARTGTTFPASTTYRAIRYRFTGAPVAAAALASDYAVLYSAQFVYLFYPPVMDMFQFTIKATNGQMNLTGAAGAMSWKAVRDAIDAMKDAETPATLTDVETGDSWNVRMEPNGGFEENGLDNNRSITVTLHEVS